MARKIATENKTESKRISKDKVRVKCALGVTITANYQSVRIDVGYEQDCGVDEREKVTKELWQLCEDQIEEESEGSLDHLKDTAAKAGA